MKIRNKLTIQFSLIVASILLLFSITIYWLSSDFREQEFYKRLKDKAQTTCKLLIEVEEVDRSLLKIIDKNSVFLPNERVIVYDYKNQMIYNSKDDDSTLYSLATLNTIRLENEIYYSTADETEVIGLTYNDKYDRFVVLASAYDKYGWRKLRFLKYILLVGWFISLCIAALAGWFYSGEALKPISEVVDEVDKISIANIHNRVNERNGTDEIAQLAITFNKMLQRLEAAFVMQKSFVSNASHELRTPLTSITGQLELSLMNKRKTEEYEQVIKSVLEDIRNLNQLSNGLLDLALTSSDISKINSKKLRIDEILWQVISETKNRHTSYNINMDIEALTDEEEKFTINGNEQLLKTAFNNIIDNACKYSEDKSVNILLKISNNDISILFSDKGIGINENELESIFQPFYRGSNVKNIRGHGLGLPLTKKIIEMHNGSISIISHPNSGTIITTCFSAN